MVPGLPLGLEVIQHGGAALGNPGRLGAHCSQVADRAPSIQAPLLEAGHDPPLVTGRPPAAHARRGPRVQAVAQAVLLGGLGPQVGAGTGVVMPEVGPGGVRAQAGGQRRHGLDDVAHLPGVVRPVGGQAPHPAGTQHPGHRVGEGRGHQAALAVAGLAPGVGEEHPHLAGAGHRQSRGQQLGGVGGNDAHVVQALPVNGGHQSGDRGLPYLHRQVVRTRVGGSVSQQRLTTARADLDDEGAHLPDVSEESVRLQAEARGHGTHGVGPRHVDDVAGPELGQGLGLDGAQPAAGAREGTHPRMDGVGTGRMVLSHAGPSVLSFS